MEIFGYSTKKPTRAGLRSLREVSFSASPEELVSLAAFLSKMASEIQSGRMKTDHVHFPAPISAPQIIVLNPRTVASSSAGKKA
jgi:hypothetical protein